MDERPPPAQPGSALPATRPPAHPAVPEPDPGPATDPASGSGAATPAHVWRRFTHTRRGAAGLAIGAAALLLWPFAGWSWWPWLAGVGALVLLRLLRLDVLLRDWVWHVGGLVVVAGLMLSTGPWAWAFAASIGVLLAGLAQLPWWRLAAVGAVLSVVTGLGYGLSAYETAQVQSRLAEQRSAEDRTQQGAQRPQGALPELVTDIAQGDVTAVCGKLDEPAETQFVQAAGGTDCASAVARFHGVLPEAPPSREMRARVTPTAGGAVVNACATVWATPELGGPELGVLTLREAPAPGRAFFIARFGPCP
jgi:hypothetical protein